MSSKQCSLSYGGYYYALYPSQGAITRNKTDGRENIVLYNDRGYKDLTKGKDRFGFDQKSVGDKYKSFLIYNDKIQHKLKKVKYIFGDKNLIVQISGILTRTALPESHVHHSV